MKQTYRVLAGLVALGVLVQAAAIAFGFFQLGHQADDAGKLTIDDNYTNAGLNIHGINGQIVIPLIGLILLIVSFFAARTVPGARKWAGIVFGLIVLQVVLAFLSFGVSPLFGALHGINALFVLGTAVRAVSLTSEPVAAAAGAPAADVPAQRPAPQANQASRPAPPA
jgi:heme A synthase